MWQGERGQCESESIGAHVCHYTGLPVCWFTLSLPIAKIPYYKTQTYNHKTFFLIYREIPTSCTRQMQFLLQNIETLWEFWYSCFASHPLNVHCISMRFLYTHNHPKKLWSLSICHEVQILLFIESSLYIYKTVILNIEHFYKKIIWSYFIEQFSFAYQEHTW